MFARLLLCDAFLHGIGGAKYDQVTDLVVQRFFGIEPPTYATVTATLRLPLGQELVSPEALLAVDARLRELEFHPESFLQCASPAAATLVDQKHAWIATEQTPANARERCRAIRAINEALAAGGRSAAPDLAGRAGQARHAAASRHAARLREYAFCLYPAGTLQKLFTGV